MQLNFITGQLCGRLLMLWGSNYFTCFVQPGRYTSKSKTCKTNISIFTKNTITGGGSTATHSKAVSADKKIWSQDFKFFTFNTEMIYRGERGKEL